MSETGPITKAIQAYLRVCSSGGMPRDKRDTVEAAVMDAERLGYFPDAPLNFPQGAGSGTYFRRLPDNTWVYLNHAGEWVACATPTWAAPTSQTDDLAGLSAGAKVGPKQIARALRETDWSGVSIGDKAILHLAIEALEGPAPAASRIGVSEEEIARLAASLVSEVDDLIAESEGVAGLHRNGDVATWNELAPGGEYERLTSLDELRAVLAAERIK